MSVVQHSRYSKRNRRPQEKPDPEKAERRLLLVIVLFSIALVYGGGLYLSIR